MIDIRKSNKLKHDSVFHRHFYLLLSLLLSPCFSFHLQLPQLVSLFFFFQFPSPFFYISPPPPSPSSQPIIFTSTLFSLFSSSFPPVPTLFLSPFFLSASPHFFHSHLFFHNQFCSYPLFPYFIPYSSLFLPLNFSAPPQSPHLASFNETWCNQNLLQACCRTSDISST